MRALSIKGGKHMKISIGAAMALAILFAGMISFSCTSDGSSGSTEDFVVTAAGCNSNSQSLSVLIPEARANYYTGSYDMNQAINYQSLVTIPGHSITDGHIGNGGMSITVTPPLDPANPNDATVFFNTDIIFYRVSEGLFGKQVVASKCHIVTPSFTITFF
jgi:hypothetical protein